MLGIAANTVSDEKWCSLISSSSDFVINMLRVRFRVKGQGDELILIRH